MSVLLYSAIVPMSVVTLVVTVILPITTGSNGNAGVTVIE
jgi:hypothetical protein